MAPYHRISSIGRCPREWYYKATGATPEPDKYALVRALEGTAIHAMIPALWAQVATDILEKPAKLQLIKTEEPIKIHIKHEYDHVITGHSDMIFQVTGALDVVTRDGEVLTLAKNDIVVGELKTVGGLPNNPYDHNVSQLQMYMYAEQAKAGLIIYLDRSIGVYRWWWIEPDNNVLKEFIEQLKVADTATAAGIPPPRLPRDSDECARCDYSRHCWRPVDLKMRAAQNMIETDDNRLQNIADLWTEAKADEMDIKGRLRKLREMILNAAEEHESKKLVIKDRGSFTINLRDGKGGKTIYTLRWHPFTMKTPKA